MRNSSSPDLDALATEIDKRLGPGFRVIERVKACNISSVHESIIKSDISDMDLAPSAGYGYSDWGREKVEEVFASVFGGADSLVRPQISTGTQAIYLSLMGTLISGKVGKGRGVLILTGEPYPTLQLTFNFLRELKVNIYEADINTTPLEEILFRYDSLGLMFIQRSKGYSLRRSLGISRIEGIIKSIRQKYGDDTLVLIDNCYAEFVAEKEPGHVGADLVVGSLLKNPGGGMVSTGGYIVGKKELIQEIAGFLYGIGVGKEVGPIHNKKEILLGLYLAPLIVSESLKGVLFGSHLFHELGFRVIPEQDEELADTVLTVVLESKEMVLRALKEVQSMGPLNPKAIPAGSLLPGYSQEVAMAGGTFTPGSSIELSADALLAPPWAFYLQGGFYYELIRETCLRIARSLLA